MAKCKELFDFFGGLLWDTSPEIRRFKAMYSQEKQRMNDMIWRLLDSSKVNQTKSDWQSEKSDIHMEFSDWEIWANECSKSDQQNWHHTEFMAHMELVRKITRAFLIDTIDYNNHDTKATIYMIFVTYLHDEIPSPNWVWTIPCIFLILTFRCF